MGAKAIELQSWPKIRWTGHKIALSVNSFILHILNQSPKFLLSCLCNFNKTPLPQTMLRATGIIWTVDKHSIVSTLHGGGGAGEQFVMKFANRPSIFGQDCLNM